MSHGAGFVREGLEEGDDRFHLSILELPPELEPGHLTHGVVEGGGFSVMEIGGGEGDVAEGGHLEFEVVVSGFRDGFAPEVLGVGVGVDGSHFLIGVGPEEGSVVAGDAACGDEGLEALQLAGGESGVVALQEFIKAVVGDEGAFEGGDGVGDVVVGDGVFLVRESFGESPLIGAEGFDFADRFCLVGDGHFNGIEDGALGLSFEGGGAAIPELGEMEAGVEDRGGVAASAFTEGSWGGGLVVDAAPLFVHGMAGVAGLGIVCGELFFEEEGFAEFDERFGVLLRTGHFFGEGFDQAGGEGADFRWFWGLFGLEGGESGEGQGGEDDASEASEAEIGGGLGGRIRGEAGFHGC